MTDFTKHDPPPSDPTPPPSGVASAPPPPDAAAPGGPGVPPPGGAPYIPPPGTGGFPPPPGAGPGYGGWPPQGPPGDPRYPGYGGHPGGYAGYPGRPPTTTAMWAHLGALLTLTIGSTTCCIGCLLGWIAPLTIRANVQNRQDPFVRHHAAQAMNYAITQGIMTVLAFALYVGSLVSFAYREGHGGQPFLPIAVLCLLGLVIVHGVTGLVFAIIGTTKANSGQWWSYPKIFALPFVKA